ncbi:hypothetical protein BCR35DRAFT_298235 [Leucosporidium creatinivorum]|uniref:Uncharacterized protein n=1 Tax=Leucosporidium creatinivorum TaxID=106004 RepID=A0A1Y2G5F4_9BASI|nr:hypothetical protein BCR35DRAFT_298235 [Leucosporidium creatinivorum]
MRRRKMSKKQKSKGVGVRVREDVDDLELAQLAAAKQGSSTAAPVLGTFPTNSSSPSTTSSALQFPQKPQGALTSAFVVPPSALASAATFTSPPLTPPSSPPDSIPVPSAPRLTPQALSTHRRNPLSAPQSTSARGDEDEPMVLSGWQDSYRGESDSDEDEPVEDILVDLQEVLEWSAGEEMDSGDGEEGDTGSESDEEDGDDRSGAPQTSPVSDAFDIPADDGAEDESSEEEDEGSTFESPIGLIPPQWSTYTSWEPPRTPTTVQSDLDALRTEVAPRTPSSFPKSFGSAGSFPFVPSALTPPTTTATSTRQAITTAFPTSFEREELQFPLARVATASVIDPTLAALSLGSTTIISSNAISAPTPSASFTATVEHKLWSPIPLRPPTRLTSTPLPANLASLLSHDIPVNSEPLPEPTLLLTPAPEPTSAVSSAGMQLGTAAPSISTSSSRFVAKVTSPFHLPAVVESPFEVEMDSEEESSQGVGKPERKELMEGEEAFVEPAPARAQAGARFIGRMLVGEQQVQGGGGGGGEGSGVDGEDGGSAASAPASP